MRAVSYGEDPYFGDPVYQGPTARSGYLGYLAEPEHVTTERPAQVGQSIQPPSRVHQLARLTLLELIGVYNSLAEQVSGTVHMQTSMSTDRDRVIAAIRSLEDPDGLRSGQSAVAALAKAERTRLALVSHDQSDMGRLSNRTLPKPHSLT